MIDFTIVILLGALLASTYAAIKYYCKYKKYKPYKKQYYDLINPPPCKPPSKTEQERIRKERYLEIRSQILLRDHFRCQKCNYYKHLEVHHIIPRSKGGTDDPSNLVTLCQRCHTKKHGFTNRVKKNKRKQHTRRNQRKKFRQYLKKHVNDLQKTDYPVQSFEGVHPYKEDLPQKAVARREELYKKWQQNELNQPQPHN